MVSGSLPVGLEENPGMALTGEILVDWPWSPYRGAGLAAGGRTALRQGGKMGLGRLLGKSSWCRHRRNSRSRDCGSRERGAGAGLGAGLGGTLGVALPAIGAGVRVSRRTEEPGYDDPNEAEEAAKRKLSKL